jgi:hypothetical protein
MLGELRLEVLHRLISAGHFLLFGVAYAVKQPLYRTGALVLVGVCSLVAWLAALRRYRLVADTPTSFIASAAQGYVELVGCCELHPGSPALGYLSGPPVCVVSLYRLSPHERGLVFDFTRAQHRRLSVAGRLRHLCRRSGPRRGDGGPQALLDSR